MIIDPHEHDQNNIYKLLIGSVVPRPIGFVSTVNAGGVRNLAPFSFFNAVCSNPPIVLFSTVVRKNGRQKDTYYNVEATGEFVVNIVSESFARQMNICSADVPPGIDEFTLSGLTPVPSDFVRPPRVQESLISMECRLVTSLAFGTGPGSGSTMFGRVLRFHIADELFNNYRIDPEKLRAVGRMGGPTYTRTMDRFEMPRPAAEEVLHR